MLSLICCDRLNSYSERSSPSKYERIAHAIGVLAGMMIISLGVVRYLNGIRNKTLFLSIGLGCALTVISGRNSYLFSQVPLSPSIPMQKGPSPSPIKILLPESNPKPEPVRIKRTPLDLKVQQGVITSGQGEYIVFYEASDGGMHKEIAPELFKQVYEIFNRNSPVVMAQNGEDYSNRYQIIREKIKEIDAHLEIAFIPRSLYGLFVTVALISEEQNLGKPCKIFEKLVKDRAIKHIPEECWHLCHFEDADPNHNRDPDLLKVAYRLNQLIIKRMKPIAQGYTYDLFTSCVEENITFLRNHWINESQSDVKIATCNGGPTSHFSWAHPRYRGNTRPMAISTESRAQIIRNVLSLECSEEAKTSLFLYRGGDFARDLPYFISLNDQTRNPYSLSFASGIVDGCVFDGGATSLYYMFLDRSPDEKSEQQAYALPIPYDQLAGLFYVPLTSTLVRIFSKGELFHDRNMIWAHPSKGRARLIGGVQRKLEVAEHLQSDLDEQTLITRFEEIKANAINLKYYNNTNK